MVGFDVVINQLVLCLYVRKVSARDCVHALELPDHVVTFGLKHFVLGNGAHLTPDAVAKDLYLVGHHIDFLKSFVKLSQLSTCFSDSGFQGHNL